MEPILAVFDENQMRNRSHPALIGDAYGGAFTRR